MMKTECRIIRRYCFIAALLAALLLLGGTLIPAKAFAYDNGVPDDYDPIPNGPPHVQMRDVFGTATVPVSGIRVIEVQEDTTGNVVRSDPEESIRFRIYNTTTQETEQIVSSEKDRDGKSWLPEMDLRKDHDYIIYVEDTNYRYPRGENYPSACKTYVQVRAGDTVTATEGAGAYNYLVNSLKYSKLGEITVERRESVCDDPFKDNRYDTCNDAQTPIKVYYKGNIRPGIKIRLISDVETIETTTDNEARLDADLIEGVTYMVYVISDRYSIDPFPIVAKDKTEYGEGLYCYNHSTCVKVNNITLYDKGDTEFDGFSRNTKVTSLKNRSVVTGMNFKNLLLIDRILDVTVDELRGRKYEVISFNAVNPTRWELSKLIGPEFGIIWKKAGGRLVSRVSYIKDGQLHEISFRQTSADNVSFTMNSLSLYPVVIEYDSSKSYSDWVAGQTDAKAKKVKTVTVNTATVNATAIDKAVRKAGGSNKYVTKIVLGSRVKTIKAKAFSKYAKVTVLEVKTKKLTKKSVRKSLKNSKIKTILVKTAKKTKTNKTYVKKYKKIFTKKNAGRKVRVR